MPAGLLSVLILAVVLALGVGQAKAGDPPVPAAGAAKAPEPHTPAAVQAVAWQPYPLAATPAERAAHPGIEKSEAAVQALADRLKDQGARYAAISGEAVRLARERQAALDETVALTGRLRSMLPRLWAMDVRLKGMVDASVAPWDEADRNLTWLGAVYGQARADLDRLRLKQSELAGNLAREAGLKPEAWAQAVQMEKTRDDLLAERLKLWRELSGLRSEHPSPEERLERILEFVTQAGFAPANVQDKPMDAARGRLPWPVKGTQASGFDPAAAPPRRGVQLATAPGAAIRAVHWGRVAFAGEVPGLGQVVVVGHGGGLCSVYGGLSRVTAKAGQEVARGEELGSAGVRAPGTGPGMYFELRFGGKPINPSRWLLPG